MITTRKTGRVRIFLHNILKRITDFLFPYYRCPSCNEEHGGICPPCLEKTVRFGNYSLGGHNGLSMYFYKGTPERLIYRFKKSLRFNALRGLTELMERYHGSESNDDLYIRITECDFMTYIPSTSKNIRKRGFDPGRMLCEKYSEITGIPVISVIRNSSKEENKKKSLIERRENVLKGLEIKEGSEDLIKNRRVLVFDDISTTGSTLETAMKRLDDAGASEVFFITIMKSTV